MAITRSRFSCAVLLIAAIASCSAGDKPHATGAPVASTSDPYTTLYRGAHPLARPEHDVGRLDAAKVLHNMALVFKLSAAQKTERDALLEAIQRPGSPSYHKWLTPEDYAERFGAGADDLGRASAWLVLQGLTVHEPSRLGARVTFTGTVAQVEAAFRTEMHRYRVGGENHYAMAHPPSLPADLADRVLAIHNTHDFFPTPQIRKLEPQATCPTGDTFCSGNAIAPPDWAVIYDVGPLYSPGINGTSINGTGTTIVAVGITDISLADLAAFRTRYGLPANQVFKTLVTSTGGAQGTAGFGAEGVLDTEWAGGIALGARINYVYTGASDSNVADAAYYAIENNLGDVLIDSWDGCEMGYTPSDADVLGVYGAAASLQGISFVSSAGDNGAAACHGKGGLWVNLPAALPEVTAVGGTGFAIPGGLTFSGGAVTGRGSEGVWSETNNAYTGSVAAGGGGISSVFARPAYQLSVATCAPVGTLPTSVNPNNQRQVPDVSFTAGTGTTQYGTFIECTIDGTDCTNSGANPQVVALGGTSAAAAAFAGLVAMADQATGSRLGNINPLLYATSASVPSAFHDITTGNNEVVCRTGDPGCPGNNLLYGFPATQGYDCATGLGSLDATNLVRAWATLGATTTALVAAPTSTTEGAPVTLTATVNVPHPNANAIRGAVTFYFRSFLANGAQDLSWSLGQASIIGGTTSSGTASLNTAIPPGMVQPGNQTVDVYAEYGGDSFHLPSYSAAAPIGFAPFSFVITPPTASIAGGHAIAYTSSGGIAPARWSIYFDSTCTAAGTGCSSINAATGSFSAGTGVPGYVIVQAIDAGGADAFSEVTVGGGLGNPPWASGPANYAGIRVAASPSPTPTVPAAPGLTPLLAAVLAVAGVMLGGAVRKGRSPPARSS
jgi:subtilase family serine protease